MEIKSHIDVALPEEAAGAAAETERLCCLSKENRSVR